MINTTDQSRKKKKVTNFFCFLGVKRNLATSAGPTGIRRLRQECQSNFPGMDDSLKTQPTEIVTCTFNPQESPVTI